MLSSLVEEEIVEMKGPLNIVHEKDLCNLFEHIQLITTNILNDTHEMNLECFIQSIAKHPMLILKSNPKIDISITIVMSIQQGVVPI